MEQRYSNYKSSGVEWIGEIPNHWKTQKVKHLVDRTKYYQIGDGDHGSIKPEMYLEEGIPYIRVQNLTWDGRIDTDGLVFISNEVHTKNLKSRIIEGDILIAKTGATIGKLGLIDNNVGESNTTSSVGKVTIDRNKHSNKFYLYNFQSNYFQKKLWLIGIQKSAQPGFNIDDLVDFDVVVPPLPEQEQIVKYLDEKTSQIDILISITEKKIELLKQKRTSLINEVVTKGLNRDVEMKDSGVEWIGEIPKHWRMNKVKRNTYVKGRIGWKGLRSEDFIDEGPFLITGTDFNKDGTINYENIYHVSQERYDEDIFIQLQDEDVLITKDGTIGKVVYVDKLNGFTCLNSGIFVTRPLNGEYISRFFFNLLRSNVFSVFIDYNSGGSTIQHLYQNVFDNFNFPIPPISEQKQIIKYLDAKNAEIDNLVSIEKRRIDTLKEYRKSLISEVVTGKIKVTTE